MDVLMKQTSKSIANITKTMKDLSIWGQLLFAIVIAMGIYLCIKPFSRSYEYEGFTTTDKFLMRTNTVDIYDDFYSDIYDYLVYSDVKDEYEVGEILRITTPNEKSRILDVGCGTGHHVSAFASNNIEVVGIDQSTSMIARAKENYPGLDFKVENALNGNIFRSDYFTHIICMYFTVYYMDDKRTFFNNCIRWLTPGGYLVVHMVDRDMFDPIVPPANPLITLTPQRYAKERITSSKVSFNDMKYSARFNLDEENDSAKFVEKFTMNNSGRVIQNEHQFYIPSQADILDIAKECGFIVQGKIDLIKSGYEYQYLYILVKPT